MKNREKQRAFLRALTVSGIMAALSFALMLLDFSLPFMPKFLKFDFSDLPALLSAFAFGPLWGIAVCLVKNLLHLTVGSTMGIGELSNFILSASFVGVAGLIYMLIKNRKGAVIASVGGAVFSAVVSLFSNYFLIYPLYISALGLSEEIIIGMYENLLPDAGLFALLAAFNIPFTFVKCAAVALIVFFIYKPLSPILKGKRSIKRSDAGKKDGGNPAPDKTE